MKFELPGHPNIIIIATETFSYHKGSRCSEEFIVASTNLTTVLMIEFTLHEFIQTFWINKINIGPVVQVVL